MNGESCAAICSIESPQLSTNFWGKRYFLFLQIWGRRFGRVSGWGFRGSRDHQNIWELASRAAVAQLALQLFWLVPCRFVANKLSSPRRGVFNAEFVCYYEPGQFKIRGISSISSPSSPNLEDIFGFPVDSSKTTALSWLLAANKLPAVKLSWPPRVSLLYRSEGRPQPSEHRANFAPQEGYNIASSFE